MLKLYKEIDGKLHYQEAWTEPENGVTVLHWGAVGTRGNTRHLPLAPGADEEAALDEALSPALAEGYAPFPEEDMQVLLVEYAVEGMGTAADLGKRHALEDALNESLGWTGLGHCDGGSIGSGSMEACCLVVDFEIAKSVIENDLAGTAFADYRRIYDENA